MRENDPAGITPLVLVVEDDEDLAGLVSMRLELEGYRVAAVHSVASALDAVAESAPSLMVLDLILGEENGRDIIGALDRRGDLPAFIVMTAHGDERVAVEMMRLGARDYIVKDEGLLGGLPRTVRWVLTEVGTENRLAEAEAALRRSDRTYRRLFETLDDVFWVVDWKTRMVVYASPAYERVWGLDPQDLYENPSGWVMYVHPDDRRCTNEAFARLAESGAYAEEYRIVRPDGRVRLIRDRGFAVANDAGEIQQVVGVAQDITEARLAEDAVRESEERLRNIVEHSTNLFYSHGADNVLTYLSPQCREILDCEPEEAMRNWIDFLTDNPLNERGYELTRTAIATGERQPPYELELRSKTGRLVWVEVREAPMVEDGRTVSIVGALTDITERKKAESALAASEERYRQLFERNVAGVFRSTIDGRLLSCNMAVAKMFGFGSPEEVLGVEVTLLYGSPEDRQRFLDELANNGSVIGWEVPMRRRDGEPLTVVLSASLIEDDRGHPSIIEGSLIDISERRRLEQQLAQVQKLEALGQLAGGIAHDFNNLLMSISGSAELLRLCYPQAGEELGEFKVIRETVKRGAELTRHLLAIARQQLLEMQALDLKALLTDELEILRRVIPENIELTLRDGESVPTVRADRGQLGQVLLNMVVNARDAMPEGGKIEIGVEERVFVEESGLGRPGVADGTYVCVSVEDDGSGMDATTLTHVFEPFYTTKDKEKGTGMGLATVYGIVKQHGGFIDVRSSPGEGTRFDVFIPVATGPVRKKSDSGDREAEGGDETILVVEDEQAVRSAIVGMLEALGYAVIEATNGRQALEVLRQDVEIDLVISDVVMPSIGGRELMERVRAKKPRLAFLFSSGYTDEALRDLLETAERTSFIAKPFTVAQLAGAVRQALASTGE